MPSPELLFKAEEEAYKAGRAFERMAWKAQVLRMLEDPEEDGIAKYSLRLLLEKMGVK